MYRFELKSEMFFGKDSRVSALPGIVASGAKRCGIVIDEGVASQPVLRTFLEHDVPAAGLSVDQTFRARSGAEPDYEYLDLAAEAFRGKPLDVMFGIGGGSAMDLAKGVAILMTNPGSGIAYRGMDKVQAPGVPLVLFPTTAGTGSEVTATASFIDKSEKVKLGINGRHVMAWRAVLDPVLTVGCPRSVTMASGMDALVHTVESFTANTTSALSRDAALAAFRRLFNHLPRAIEAPDDILAREQMMLGAYEAGVALWNAAGGGPASAISYPLGVLHAVPHGFAGGLLLPLVVRFNERSGYAGYEPLYDAIDGGNGPYRAGALADEFEVLYRRIDAPRSFVKWGVNHSSTTTLVKETVRTRSANLGHNPVPFGEQNVQEVLTTMMELAGS
jgi:alcohol dehydrogenase class IV